MAYELIKNLTKVNYTKGNNGRKYIVIHYTGNKTDTAIANSNYFKSVNRGASAHYFVDRTSVYQVVDDNDTAWAVGKNYGNNNLFGRCTNGNSINIEMCSNNGEIHIDTYKNTVELTKNLMKKYNIPASNVVRHYDVCSKICPGWKGWTGSDISIWKKFKKDIISKTSSTSSNNISSTTSSASTKKTNINVTYAVKTENGKILSEVKNLTDYAGIENKNITDLAVKVDSGSIKYQVHVKGGKWLPYVTGYNWNDINNGYAGNSKVIDAIRVVYIPNSKTDNRKAKYRVSPTNSTKYYDWQINDIVDIKKGYDGYAGCYGVSIDKIQIVIE